MLLQRKSYGLILPWAALPLGCTALGCAALGTSNPQTCFTNKPSLLLQVGSCMPCKLSFLDVFFVVDIHRLLPLRLLSRRCRCTAALLLLLLRVCRRRKGLCCTAACCVRLWLPPRLR